MLYQRDVRSTVLLIFQQMAPQNLTPRIQGVPSGGSTRFQDVFEDVVSGPSGP